MTDPVQTVNYWNYLKEYSICRDEYLSAVDAVFSSGQLILGQQVAALEKEFAAYCGASYAIGVNSCTDAIFLALKALNIGSGDEVITVSNTAVPTVAAIRASGATPVFVDVEEDTYLMDVKLLKPKLGKRTRCIIPVHLCGQMVDMNALLELTRKRGIAIIEDCAQACGATINGRRAGSFGDIGAFSFYPTKILGAFGDGGMIVSSCEDIAARLKRLRMYGMDGEYYSEEEGYNSRLDEVQAAILRVKLPKVDAAVNRRRRIAAVYDSGLTGLEGVNIPAVKYGRTHQYYLYTISATRRHELMQYLLKLGIETKINYPWPVHCMRGYDFLGCHEGSLPVTERLARTIVSLPMYPEMSIADAERVVSAIRQFCTDLR